MGFRYSEKGTLRNQGRCASGHATDTSGFISGAQEMGIDQRPRSLFARVQMGRRPVALRQWRIAIGVRAQGLSELKAHGLLVTAPKQTILMPSCLSSAIRVRIGADGRISTIC